MSSLSKAVDDTLGLFRLPCMGSGPEGFLTVATVGAGIPFAVQRVHWTFGTPPAVERGGHANRLTRQVLVSVAGKVVVSTETLDGRTEQFILDDPSIALHLPPLCWRTIRFSKEAVLLVIASTLFEESDYIRSLALFRKLRMQ